MIGAHWPSLLTTSAHDTVPAAKERRLERALAAAGAVAWEWDVSTGESSLSAGTVALVSLKDDPAAGFFALVHPQDRVWLKQAITDAARGRRAYDFAFRLLCPDGRVEWVRDRGQLERDADGRPWRLAGVAQLITEQKQAEARYCATFEQAAVGMAHVAPAGAILRVNDCLCRILGRSRQTLLSLGFQDLTHPDDLEADVAQADALLAGDITTYSMEKRYLRGNGAVVWANLTVSLVRHANGEPDHFISVVEDITQRKVLEAQAQADALMRGLMEVSPNCVKLLDPEGRMLSMNAAGQRALEIEDPARLRGCPWEVLWPEASRPQVRHAVERARAGQPQRFAAYRPTAAGKPRWWDSEIWLLPGGDGRLIAMSRDVSDINRTMTALAEAKTSYEQFLDRMPAELAVFDTTMRYLAASRRYLLNNGLEAYVDGRIAGQDHYAIFPNIPPRWQEIHRRVLLGERVANDRDHVIRPDGSRDLVRWEMTPWWRHDGSIGGALLFAEVVTERRHAEEALAGSEAGYRAIFEQAAIGIAHLGVDGRWLRVNQHLCTILGYTEEELLERTFQDITHPDDLEASLQRAQALLTGDVPAYTIEKRYVRKDETLVWAKLTVTLMRGADGQSSQFITAFEDISARKAAEAALRESNARFQDFIEAMPQMAFLTRADGYNEFQNRRWSEYTGIPQTESVAERWVDVLHPDDRDATWAAWKSALATGETYMSEHRLRAADGSYRWFLSRAAPVRDARTNEIRQWFGTSTDISEIVAAREIVARSRTELEDLVTERTRVLSDAAHELAAEIQRREEMQAILLHTRKLEALGQLTSGVAHDFNNILTGIMGSYSMIRRRIDAPAILDLVTRGEQAVARAVNLIRQLLAFARKEDLRPAVIDVAAVLRGAEDMLRHAISSNIRYVVEVPEDTWPVLSDHHQLEVALLNLAVNARDAMPDGGMLTISARNLDAASRPAQLPSRRDYIAIAVSDTGSGMPPEVIRRATEPFYTTKEQGKGTGLGLAMVNGFVEQSGGCLRIESRMGAGTTIEIILPRADQTTIERPAQREIALDRQLHGNASILVVDDDELLRPLVAALLRDLGYAVVEARNAEVALALVHTLNQLDLVITDVVMTGANGAVLAAKLRAERPGLPILFITGYDVDAALANEVVLGKPFIDQDLAGAVLRCLGRRPRSAANPPFNERFAARLRTQPLRELYLAWSRAGTGSRLPYPDDVDPAAFGLAAVACRVAADTTTIPPGFRVLQVGRALEARLGRSLQDERLAGDQPRDEVLGSLVAAYQRCVEQKMPVYQSARYDFGDGNPVQFDRLLLPFSAHGPQVTHLLAIVQYEGHTSHRDDPHWRDPA